MLGFVRQTEVLVHTLEKRKRIARRGFVRDGNVFYTLDDGKRNMSNRVG